MRYQMVAIASIDGDSYDLTAFVPEDWTKEQLQNAVKEAKAKLYSPDTHPDDYDADAMINELAKHGVIAGGTYHLDSCPVVWGAWEDMED